MTTPFDPPPGDTDAELTELINRMLRGENTAANRAFARLLPALRREARKRLKSEWRGHDVETDVLVDTSLRRLLRPAQPFRVGDRDHFMNLAKLQMNRKLIERSRLVEHRRVTRPLEPHHARVEPEAAIVAHTALAASLEALRAADAVRYRIIVMRDLHGASWQETADAVGLTPAATKYRHLSAYAWLAADVTGRRRAASP